MNVIYRLIWSRVLNGWVAVAEGTRTRSKDGRAGAASLAAGMSRTALSLTAWSLAALPMVASAAPAGGVVVAGSALISQSGATTTIAQSSKNVSLNWNSFNVAGGETVNFVQPSASSLAVNRIGGGSASQILGSVNANGQLYLVNPSGILFGRSAQVNVGGLIATTLDVAGDGDGPTRKFNGASNASIINQGNLHAAHGGYIGLLGSEVLNQGIITAQMGTVALAGGNAVTLTFSGDGLLNVQVDKSTFDTLIDNRGVVIADGGLVMMSAGARDSLLNNAANNSGIIEARGVENRNGKIVLSSAGSNGKSSISGTLDVSADAGVGGTIAVGGRTNALAAARLDASGSGGGGLITVGGGWHGQEVAGSVTSDYVAVDANSTLRAQASGQGNGGQVVVWSNQATHFAGTIDGQGMGNGSHGGDAEVSSRGMLDYRGSTNLLSSLGSTGTLLLDPYNLTISAATASNVSGTTATGNDSILNANTLQTALNSANVVVSTGASGSQAGNITVADRVRWNAATTLTLNAAGAIAINAPLVSPATGGLILTAGAGQTVSATGVIDVGSFNLTQGNWIQNAATLPAFTVGNFTVGSAATFLRASGGTGAVATPWLVSDVYGMQGMGTAAAYLSGNYALAGNIDATSTAGWNAAAGFLPVGPGPTPFTGTLNGRNYSVLNLAISQPSLTTGVGLFGSLNNATVSNLSLLNASVTGGSNGTGALAGRAIGTSALSGIVVTGSVAGTNFAGVDNIGGIVGNLDGSASLVNSASAANVTGYSHNVGGLAGGVDSASNVIRFASATGTVSGYSSVGGLIGHSGAMVADSYASGAVTQLSGGADTGGLIGKIESTGSVSRAYATGAVNGTSTIGGLIGALYGTATDSYWNTETSGRVDAVGFNSGTISNVNGVGSAAMHTQASFSSLDFTNHWYLTPEYNPTLRAGTTLLGGTGNLSISTGADASTNFNTTSLQNLLGAGNVLVATGNGTLTVNASSPVNWFSANHLGLAASGNLLVNSAANLTGTGAGSALNLFSTAGSLGVSGTTLSVNDGQLGLMAPTASGNDGITLTGTSLGVGSGSGSVVGTTTTGNAIHMIGDNVFNSTGSGTINVVGNARTTGRGILVNSLSNLTTNGNVGLTGNSTMFVGVSLSCGGCGVAGSLTNASGNLAINGYSYVPVSGGTGLDLYGETLTNASAGSFTINGYNSSVTGVNVNVGALNMNNSNGGTLALGGYSANGPGIYLDGGAAINSSGNVSITAKSLLASSTSASFFSAGTAHTITNTGGNLNIIAGDATTKGTGFLSNFDLTLNNTGSGILSLVGTSGAGRGIDIGSQGAVTTSGIGAVNLTGAGVTKDIFMIASGQVNLGKGTLTGANGKGINIVATTGALMIANATVNSNNGALVVSATNAGASNAVTLNGATLNAGSGAATITGNAGMTGTVGVNLLGANAVSSIGAGSVIISGGGGVANSIGLSMGAGQSLTTQGSTKLTDLLLSSATTAISVAGTITAASGNLTLAPDSVKNLVLLPGSQITSTGNGNLLLSAIGAGTLTNNGTIAQGSGGSGGITINTVNGALTNAGIVSGGATAGAISLSTSGSGAIADAAGTINQAGTGAINVIATGTGTVSADTITYSNAAANSLTVSGAGAVTTSNAIASTGGALGVGIGGAAVTLGPSIASNGGNITVTGATVLGANATLTAGAGTIGFTSTVNGNKNLTASGATINLAQAVGGSTALGAVSLQAVNSLSLPSIQAASLLARTTGATSDISIASGATLALSSSGNAATLAAGRNFINNAGAGAINMSGGGRWLIYSATPAADTFNNLDSGNAAVWASTYAGTTPSFSQAGNRYVFAYQPTLTFTSNNTSKTYGTDASAAVANAYTVSGLQAGVSGAYLGDTAAVYSGAPTVTSNGSAAAATVAGGPYAINVAANNLASLDNYALAYQSSGLLTDNRAALTVTAGDAAKTYDGLAYSASPDLSYSGFVNGQNSAVITGTNVLAGSAQGAINAGSYTILASGLGASNYTLTYAPGTLTVGQAGLTIKANGASKTYDGLAYNGGNGVAYTGLVNNETAAVLSGTLGYGGTAQGAKNAGSYGITANGLTSGNYAITYQAGGLTINPAALTITANNASKTYDGLAYSNAAGVTYNGLVNSETPSVLTGTLTSGGAGQGAVNAGNYALTASGLSSSNYAISYVPGTLDVAKAALSVTASDATKTYDGLAYSGGNGVTYAGLVHGETDAVLTGTPIYSGAAQGKVNAGDYALIAFGLSSGNYAISYVAGNLHVGQAALTVTANNTSKTYDGLAYTGGNGVSYAGLVHGENQSVLTGTAIFGGAAQGAVAAGNYALTASGLSSSNYAISYLPGSLTVGQAALAVTANHAGKTYDGLAFSGGNGITYSGFVNGENSSVLTGTTVYGGAAQNAVSAGSYGLTTSGLSSGNYAISYVPGTLTVGRAALAVTAADAFKTYDGLAYTGGVGLSYAGFVHGENQSVLAGTPVFGGTQNAIDAGTYALTASGLASNNYAISYLPGSLTIGQAALSVTANNASKIYDGLAYAGANGLTYTGFVHGENATVLNGTASFAGAAQSGINVGTYALTAAGLWSKNYAISYLPGILNVTPAALTVTANQASKTYDGLAYTGGNGVTYTGLVNGETAAVLSGTARFGGSAQGARDAGTYSLTAAGLSSNNYAISYAPGRLTVGQAPLTISVQDATKTYDGLAYTGHHGLAYTGFVNGETAASLTGNAAFGGSAQGAANAGTYSLTASGLVSDNYAIHYVPGSLQVSPAALTVTANNAIKPYNGRAFIGGNGVSYDGFVHGENQAVLGGTAVFGGTAQGAIKPGAYSLLAAGLTSGNYAIHYLPGWLGITPAVLSATTIKMIDTYIGLARGERDTMPVIPSDLHCAAQGAFGTTSDPFSEAGFSSSDSQICGAGVQKTTSAAVRPMRVTGIRIAAPETLQRDGDQSL